MSDTKRHPALWVGTTKDGNPLFHRRGESGLREMRPLKEGQPIGDGEIVTLHETNLSPVLWESESHGRVSTGHDGPARYTTQAYRDNYEANFGRKDDLPN